MNNQPINSSATRRSRIEQFEIPYLVYVVIIGILFTVFWYTNSTTVLYIAIAGAWIPLAYNAIRDLNNRKIGTEFFLVFATVFALIGGQTDAIMIILMIMLIATYMERLIEYRTQSALEHIVSLIPDTVTVTKNGTETTVPLRDVTVGMNVIINTGQRIPVDGTVVKGHASVNEAPLTGESLPIEKQIGMTVYAGSFVEAGSVVVRTEKKQEESMFGKMTALLRETEKRKARITVITDRLAFILTPVLLIVIMIIWLITRNFRMAVTLLVFGSPLELALATPLAMLAGTVAAFRKGILVKGGQALQECARTTIMAFDKTGTLTFGTPRIVEIESFDSTLTNKDILRLAAMTEKRSGHVLAKAIVQKAQDENIVIDEPDTYESTVGHGIEVTYKKNRYLIGNKHFITAPEHGSVTFPDTMSTCPDQELHSTFYLACNNTLIGKICTADSIRPAARTTIKQLKKERLTLMLISGDRQEVADRVGKDLGIPDIRGNIFPDQKLRIIEELQQKGNTVTVIGDGINDAPALKQANVGIAMGAMGMEPAIEAANIVLMTNEVEHVYYIYMLSKKIMRIITQNLFIGFVMVHSLGFILALLQLISPVQAALVHAFADILILLNSARLIRFTPPK